ncbi:MAG TPA: radical SAM protein [Bryobacteraceae bacterium]|nr:radical SAM protein [Bryobacteraceae bacterium]
MSASLPILQSGASFPRSRNTTRPVVLVGFQEQGNLGLGYLASTLRREGYKVEIFDFETDPAEIYERILPLNPLLVGFSLIFQFYVHRFDAAVRYLRSGGIDCHITIGGHFPSLSYQQTLDLIPDLDSVVRFEGEMTLLELADRLGTGRDWKDLQGIAYRENGDTVANPLRPLIHDLDDLPYPARNFETQEVVLGRRIVPILASRGCARTCSFCSIHMFYRAVPGKVVRTRKPAEVAAEMKMLHEEHGATIFLFQDDDFPLAGPAWKRWTREFLGELHKAGLPGRVIWKISCRADVVEPELFIEMREAGLYMVYMGLESGSEDGLDTLHKQISVEQNIRAVDTLKSIGIGYAYGFMMFDPSTTFESIHDNVKFLRRITGDGSAGAVFCRMLPYDGTPIKTTLEAEGRLRGDVCNPDYEFLDPRVEDFYGALKEVVDVTGWIHGHRALSPQLSWAWNEVAVLERLFPALPGMEDYKQRLRGITSASNEVLFRVVEDLCRVYTDGGENPWDVNDLEEQSGNFLDEMLFARNSFVAANQDVILAVLEEQAAHA